MNEVIREFLLETQENLAQLDNDLVTLEKDPTEKETLARVFRTLHTVKGTAGFLGLMKLQAVAHSAEMLVERVNAGASEFNLEMAGALLAAVETIRRMVAEIERTEHDGSDDRPGSIKGFEEAPSVKPDKKELTRRFVQESNESLTHMDHDLLALEINPADSEALWRVYRTLNTIAGTAGLLRMPKLQAVAGTARKLAWRLITGASAFNAEITGTFFVTVDWIRETLLMLDGAGSEGPSDYSLLVETLEKLQGKTPIKPPEPPFGTNGKHAQ